jgi:exopolysaccharide biosynthesis polyprenyl glycosylphosphotransferase
VSATSESSSAPPASPVSSLRALDTEVVIDGRFTIDRTAPPPARGLRAATRDERLRRALMVGDFVAIALAATLQAVGNGFSRQWPLLLLAVPLWLVVAGVRDLYRAGAWRWDHAGLEEFGSILAVTAQWGLISLVFGWTTGMVSVVKVRPLAIGWMLTVAAVLVVHALVRAHARRQPWYWENAIVLGARDQNDRVVRRLSRLRRLGVNVVACVEPAAAVSGDAVAATGRAVVRYPDRLPVPIVPDAPQLMALLRDLEVDRVVVAGPLHSEHQRDLIIGLADHDVHIDLMPEWGELVSARLEVRQLAGVPLLSIPCGTLDPMSVRVKRAFDIVVSATALLLLSPILLACAVAIKLDTPGPVFFRQRRVGKDDERFEVLKFRSMYLDAEARKAEVAALNLHGGGNERGMFKIREDPRITPVGGFLRRSSFDELPQLVNVLRGDMSLVGPRPLIESEHAQISGRFRRRSSITPGVTGLWQVNGRSEVPFEEMISLDLLYAATWSLRRDLKLLARTVSAVLHGDGAY